MDFTARIFSIETGWPPPELFVTVSITSGMFFAPSRSMVSASRAASIFPLKGCTYAGSFASAMGRSSGLHKFPAFFACGAADGLDALDAKRLNDRLDRHFPGILPRTHYHTD